MIIQQLLSQNPIVPLVSIGDARHAVGVAKALIEGGIGIIEVALRTDAAIDSIVQIRSHVPEIIVGAGSIKSANDLEVAIKAGAQFAVSPGCTPELISAAQTWDIAFLPAAAIPSEALGLLNAGFEIQKFFPAEAMGGIATLQSLYGPLPEIKFCASGGISPSNFERYLALPNVIAVSGSWLVPSTKETRIAEISQLARDARAMLNA